MGQILSNDKDKSKLIAQCYDGASILSSRQKGVQAIVKEKYPNAHYVYCYSHQLNLIIQLAVSEVSSIRVFFANLNGF